MAMKELFRCGLVQILTGILIFLGVGRLSAQNDIEERRYRVTAYRAQGQSVSSLSNIASATPTPVLYVPSAFTPNGDGINDSFGVESLSLKWCRIRVFNRWGETVFETEDPKERWDGTYKGQKITSTDVFVYTVNAIGRNGEPMPEINGSVTLVAEGAGEY